MTLVLYLVLAFWGKKAALYPVNLIKINQAGIKASDPNIVALLSLLFIINGISDVPSGKNILENTETGESANELNVDPNL